MLPGIIEEILPLGAVLCSHADEPRADLAFCTQENVSRAGPWHVITARAGLHATDVSLFLDVTIKTTKNFLVANKITLC